MQLYIKPDILKQNDIILTTSSYYHFIATTLSSLNISINRIFFDEIDSISNIICTNINSNFFWFVSATFDLNYLGYFKNKLMNIDNIICKCEDDFIDENIYLEPPNLEDIIMSNSGSTSSSLAPHGNLVGSVYSKLGSITSNIPLVGSTLALYT